MSSRFSRAPHKRHRPALTPARGSPVLLVPHFPEGACGTTGRFTAPAAPRAVKHVAAVRRSTRQNNSLGRSAYACVPHATVLSACNSQRHHALGALTECLASPHCWVLGPPTSSAGHRPFTTLRVARLTARLARKAHRRNGSVASRSCADDETGAPLWPERDGQLIFLDGYSVKLISEKPQMLCKTCAIRRVVLGR